MKHAYESSRQGQGLTIGIVVAQFNSFVTERLLAGAQSALEASGVPEEAITTVYVPGAFELPLTAKKMAQSGRYNVVICLGAVIRGETPHFDYISESTAQGILQAGLETGIPVIFGVLTTDTVEQARSRAGAQFGNSGENAALSAIQMANLLRDLGEG